MTAKQRAQTKYPFNQKSKCDSTTKAPRAIKVVSWWKSMAGRRLVDAAKVLDAARSVAKQHWVLRQQQWDVYSKTSSLAKAVKHQTDRVTVTAYAAYELAKRLDETGPAWQSSRRSEQRSEASEDVGRTEDEAKDTGEARRGPVKATGSDVLPQESIKPTGERGPVGELQTQQELKSAMRRDDAEEAHHHIAQAYTDSQAAKQQTQSTAHVEAEQEDLPEGASLEGLFASRRVSRTVGNTGPNISNPFGNRKKLPPKPLPEMIAAEKERTQNQAQAEATSHTTESRPTEVNEAENSAASYAPSSDIKHSEAEEDMQKLGESIASDAKVEVEDGNTSEQPYEMHESRVPSSRFGRLWQYGGLATSMAFGAVGEGFRRFAGGSNEGSLMMSEANMNRLVARLSRMRGAALKLGQMVSFQDSKLLPPTINKVLQRVQDSADYMPPSQRDKVLRENLGADWRSLFSNFEEKPFAAASIGQVHKATLASNGKDVAVKVQYPGVRNSIDSDLNNLSMLLTASRLLPKGLFLDKTIANARVELAWECDYEREAKACMRFKELVQEESNIFTVPEVYPEASGPGVLTAEFVLGSAVTKMKDLSQDDRDWVGTQILRLCLRELMEWRFMQTDPNWTNFLYNRETKKLELLDFGASREFPDKFVEPYVSLLIAASKGERDRCRDLSIQLGYLTGEEGKDMVQAHVDSIMTLAEPFVESAPEVYNFEDQTITDRVRANIGLMLRERLAPPPEETYSLHRKLSGLFLLCARLQSRVRARELFANAVAVWNGRDVKI